MSEFSQEKVIEYLSGLSVMEIAGLTKALEEKWGVSAAPVAAFGAVPLAAAGGGEDAKAEEQTEFTVELQEVGDKKIEVVKAIRAITGVSLKEAKDLVDGAPGVVKTGVSKAEAEDIKKKLQEAGAKVAVK
ncbi:MAG: 50S ribosomal protein L7/L12 [Myxococcota bacterium]|nr:50S ribosomal protein L7/L12 [Myxococcota bacterium]